MQLVWLFDRSKAFEYAWLHELLEPWKPHLVEIEDLDAEMVYENACIVFNHFMGDYEEYFRRYHEERIPFGAIHLSDETLEDTMNYLQTSECVFAFRNYHHPVYSKHPKVVTFGLGYKSGYEKVSSSPLQSQPWYHWCFAGAIYDSRRLDALKAFTSHTPYLFHNTGHTFHGAASLGLDQYKSMMMHSKFAICPIGQCNLDSYRVYEALESSCIPVVLSMSADQPYSSWGYESYWHALFPNEAEIPWIVGRTWQECSERMAEILKDPIAYHNMRQATQSFWQKWKKKWSQMLCDACMSLQAQARD